MDLADVIRPGRCAALVIDRNGHLLRSRRWHNALPRPEPASAAD